MALPALVAAAANALTVFVKGELTLADDRVARMRVRAQYFRDQAKWLRETGAKPSLNDAKLRERFNELAQECDNIAEKIERSINSGVFKS